MTQYGRQVHTSHAHLLPIPSVCDGNQSEKKALKTENALSARTEVQPHISSDYSEL